MNVILPCSIIADDYDPGDGTFWKINGSVYGPLQVPSGFSVCDEISCDLASLVIPVLQREMDGITIQCVGIDYHNNTQYLGGVTVLEVLPLPQGILCRYSMLARALYIYIVYKFVCVQFLSRMRLLKWLFWITHSSVWVQ